MTKEITKKNGKGQSLSQILQSKSFMQQVARALPTHLTPDRFLRVALTEIRKNPDLAVCEQKSFLGAIVQCSQLGLEPGDGLGLAYLIPYNNRKINSKDCQLIIGYRGLIELARRSGQIVSIGAHCVYEKDTFIFEYGLNEKLKHIPSKGERGNIVAVYAIAKFKDGGHQMEVMFKNDIEKIRKSSKAASSSYSPWTTHYEEMARKTVIRRLCKYLPSSPELNQAVILDEKADIGKQNLAEDFDIVDVEVEEVEYENNVEEKQTDEMKKALAQEGMFTIAE